MVSCPSVGSTYGPSCPSRLTRPSQLLKLKALVFWKTLLIEACIANVRRATNGSPGPLAFTSELPNISCAGINERLSHPRRSCSLDAPSPSRVREGRAEGPGRARCGTLSEPLARLSHRESEDKRKPQNNLKAARPLRMREGWVGGAVNSIMLRPQAVPSQPARDRS